MVSKQVNIEFIINFIENLLPNIVHHRNLLANFRAEYPRVLESLSTVEIHVDFSENLTLTLPEEIQSMYWGQAKTQVTIHSGILKFQGNKTYHPYFSDDLTHDQSFVNVTLYQMLSSIEIEPKTSLIITSDNCKGQYKSTQNFFDLQRLSNHYQCTIVRIYGIAGHGKNEVDAVGGVAKIAIRKAIAQGQSFFNSEDCIDFLMGKFGECVSPTYSVQLIDPEKLADDRKEARFQRFPTIKGSSTFQIIIFHPDSDVIKVAPSLCGCDLCLSSKYGSCDNFSEHFLETGTLNRVSLRNQVQEFQSNENDDDDDFEEKFC